MSQTKHIEIHPDIEKPTIVFTAVGLGLFGILFHTLILRADPLGFGFIGVLAGIWHAFGIKLILGEGKRFRSTLIVLLWGLTFWLEHLIVTYLFFIEDVGVITDKNPTELYQWLGDLPINSKATYYAFIYFLFGLIFPIVFLCEMSLLEKFSKTKVHVAAKQSLLAGFLSAIVLLVAMLCFAAIWEIESIRTGVIVVLMPFVGSHWQTAVLADRITLVFVGMIGWFFIGWKNLRWLSKAENFEKRPS